MLRFLHSKIGLFIIALAVILLLIFLNYLKALKPLEDLFFICTKPLERAMSRGTGKIVIFFNIITSIRNLHRENQMLIEENENLLAENIKLRELREENKFIRSQLDLKEEKGIIGVYAAIIGKNSDGLVQSVKINKGSKQGIEEGAPVVLGDGFLVGRVIEVYYNTAQILLITDQNSVVNAMISDSRATGNIAGQHGLGLTMDLIPQTEVVKIGDTVITSGLSGDLPKGLGIGEVVKIDNSANELFQKALVKPYVNFSKLERVLVITEINK